MRITTVPALVIGVDNLVTTSPGTFQASAYGSGSVAHMKALKSSL